MTVFKFLIIGVFLSGLALANVPSLINYQGRLVDGVGNPIVGKKEFKLDIYDSQTEGTLIYQETLPDITLDEDGAYSFQFGAGVSRTETSEIIATGDGETMLFQTPLGQAPLGPITVTDGTNSFTQGDVATGEEPFTFLYVRGVNRINLVCNEPPATGVSFTATYRYNEAGIVGALGTAAEHWMEVTIGGDKQEPRQRLVAVPFALRAGVAEVTEKSNKLKSFAKGWDGRNDSPSQAFDVLIDPIRTIKRIKVNTYGSSTENVFRIVRILKDDLKYSLSLKDKTSNSALNSFEVVFFGSVIDEGKPFVDFEGLNLVLDHDSYYYFPYMYTIYNTTGRWQAHCPDFLEIFYTES